MSGRWFNVIALLVFVVVACPGIYVWFRSPSMGYPAGTAAAISGIPALLELVLLPLAWKGKL